MKYGGSRNPAWPERARRLQEGKTYRFVPLNGSGNQYKPKVAKKAGDKDAPFKATVKKAYKTWYLLVTPMGYRTTMHVCAIGQDWEAKEV